MTANTRRRIRRAFAPSSVVSLGRWSFSAVRMTGFVGLLLALLSPFVTNAMGVGGEDTVTAHVRRNLAALDARCRYDRIGPYLDPKDPQYRQKLSIRTCDLLQVRPVNLEAIKTTPEEEFVYSIELPPPLDKPQVRYRGGMGAEGYQRELCEKEGGDFVFETATDVNLIRQLRATPSRPGASLASYSEEVTQKTYLAAYTEPELMFVAPGMRRYSYLEVPAGAGNDVAPFQLFYRDRLVQQFGSKLGVSSKPLVRPTARYAYAWRAVEREGARKLGIVGGELIVVDLDRFKVMAVRRDFAIDVLHQQRLGEIAFSVRGCRAYGDEGGRFISRVLIPPKQ